MCLWGIVLRKACYKRVTILNDKEKMCQEQQNYDKGWMVQPAKGRANQIFWTCSQRKDYMNNVLEH